MPRYCYTCEDCEAQEERDMPRHARRSRWVRCGTCGGIARRDFHAEQTLSSSVQAAIDSAWANHTGSDALAIHPEQLTEARAHNAGHDSQTVQDTEYDAVGRPKFTSRSHRRKYGQHWQVFDQDGGYSDAQKP